MAGATTSMTIRMNREVKEQSQALFKSLGLDMTTAINMFLRQSLMQKGLPFAVTLPAANKHTLAALKVAEEDKVVYGPFNTIDEVMESLNAED